MTFRRTATLSLATLLWVMFGCAPTEPPAPTAENQETTVEETHGPDDAGTLADRHWSLEAFGAGDTRVPPLEGTEITMSFTGDGQANGTGGCNRYFGSFETGEAGALSFGPLGSTRMACPTEIMDQETAFHRALEDTSRYEIDRDRLTLFSGDDTGILTFVEHPAPARQAE
jgi:heat shock protein HslJ